MRPLDPVTQTEAAHILGCSLSTVRRLVLTGVLAPSGGRYQKGRLSRAEVEALAAERYKGSRRTSDPAGYWMTGQAAADLLGVTRQRLHQLGDKGSVPFVRRSDGLRLYRRYQLTVMADARGVTGHAPEAAGRARPTRADEYDRLVTFFALVSGTPFTDVRDAERRELASGPRHHDGLARRESWWTHEPEPPTGSS